MPTMSDMMSSINISKTDPFHSSSIFKNPATTGLNNLTNLNNDLTTISNIPGLPPNLQTDTNDAISQITDYQNMVQNNLTSRLKTMPADFQKVTAANKIKGSILKIDGEPSAGCQLIEDIFGSIQNIGEILENVVSGISFAVGAVMGVIGGTIGVIISTLTTALNTITTVMNQAISELTTMIANELQKFADLLDELIDFSYLISLINIDICGQKLFGNILNTDNVDLDTLGQL